MSEPIIRVRELRKVFRVGELEVHALRGVNLTVPRGEFLCVAGPSGSGKSTLFHILGGLLAPTSGSVMVGGHELASLSDGQRTALRRRMVGFVFQRFNLLPTLTAADNIAIARHIAGRDQEQDGWFRQVLELLGIADRLQHKPSKLSGGEQQRVAIARAIVNQPAILLADEPTGNLDSQNAAAVLGILRDLNQRLRQTILLITHDPEVASYAHRVVHMRDGRLVDAEG